MAGDRPIVTQASSSWRPPGLPCDTVTAAREAFRHLRSLRLIYVLGSYVRRGGAYEMRSNMGGDGSGVAHGRERFTIEVESGPFWKLWSEIARKRSWKG